MKSGDSQGAYVALHYRRTANEADQNLLSTVVTLPNCQADKFTQRYFDVGFRIAIRKRTERSRDYVCRQKSHGSIQSNVHRFPKSLIGQQFSRVRQVQGCKRKRIFVHGLHWRVVVRVEVTIKLSAWEHARNGHGPLGIFCNRSDFGLERVLGKTTQGHKSKK